MKPFKKIFVEITNSCNLSCSFCHPGSRPASFMAPATFETILRRIEGHTRHLCLHVLGEPLLHPELPELLETCTRRGMRVNLTTNGTLLPRWRTVLLDSPALRQINISLHSFEEESVEVSMVDYLDSVLAFADEARHRTDLFISLRLWNLQPQGGETNDKVLERLQSFFRLPSPITAEAHPGQGITLAPRVFLSQARRFAWPHDPAPDLGERGTCRALRDHVAILVDGTLVPCCLDAEADIPLGNLLDSSFEELLASPRAVAMRQGFLQGRVLESLCRRCTYRTRF